MNTMKKVLLVAATAWVIVGCGDEGADLLGGRNPGAPNEQDGPTGAPDAGSQMCETRGRAYIGFGNTSLTASRIDGAIGADRARVKPISALRGEYPRVSGKAPPSLDSVASSFGTEPARWFQKPIMSAVAVVSVFRLGFETCLAYTQTGSEYAALPTAGSAPTVCAALERKLWSRTPSPAEINECTQVAIVDSAAEPDPRRRWAYTCASVLSAAGFMTY